jgi:hypothetical protein
VCPKKIPVTVVHISGNDFHNGDILNVIYEKYESLLCQLLVMCQHDTVIMVSGIPPRYGVNVDGLNMMLDELCENLNLQFCSLIRFGHINDGCDQ